MLIALRQMAKLFGGMQWLLRRAKLKLTQI